MLKNVNHRTSNLLILTVWLLFPPFSAHQKMFFLIKFVSCFQSMIGRRMLEFQLRRLGIFNAEESISSYPNFDESYKICEYFLELPILFSALVIPFSFGSS